MITLRRHSEAAVFVGNRFPPLDQGLLHLDRSPKPLQLVFSPAFIIAQEGLRGLMDQLRTRLPSLLGERVQTFRIVIRQADDVSWVLGHVGFQ